MQIDVKTQINAVSRKIGSRQLESGEARTVVVAQTYDATVDDLWDAITNIERIPRWLMPISGDLKLGGRYQLEGNAGGTIETCDPPKSFSATWEYDGNMSWIEVGVSAVDGGSRLQVEHIAEIGTEGEKWKQFGPGAVGIGWDMMIMGLYLHLSTGASVSPEEAMAWAMSPDGMEFMNLSNEAWYEADVASGTAVDEARRGADAVLAAYTAPPEEPPAQ